MKYFHIKPGFTLGKIQMFFLRLYAKLGLVTHFVSEDIGGSGESTVIVSGYKDKQGNIYITETKTKREV